MPRIKIGLANVRCPNGPRDSIDIALNAIMEASGKNAAWVCFPECLVPGYELDPDAPSPETAWMENAWALIDECAAEHRIGVVLGTQRPMRDAMCLTARITYPDGSFGGFQDKVQLDPSEESRYVPGAGRQVFRWRGLCFGVVICHEGWRYPETVRWAAREGAHLVFHPHFEIVSDPSFRPDGFADPRNTFHEKASLCRAAENTCYFATVNAALVGSSTTSAIIDPDGVLVAAHPRGEAGILLGDIETERATGFLAGRLKADQLTKRVD